MIHHSNPRCNVCGERHGDGDLASCHALLAEKVEQLKSLVEDAYSEGVGDADGEDSWTTDKSLVDMWNQSDSKREAERIAKGGEAMTRTRVEEAMVALENMPQGGIGDDGPTLAELGEAEKKGHVFGEDASYHQAQKAWRLLQKAVRT